METLKTLDLWREDLLAMEKWAAETIEWDQETGGARSFEVALFGETSDPMRLSGRVNRAGEWTFILTAGGNMQILRGCSQGGHAVPGYHGFRHPTLRPATPHIEIPELVGATADQALQHFCRTAHIQFKAGEQMTFGHGSAG